MSKKLIPMLSALAVVLAGLSASAKDAVLDRPEAPATAKVSAEEPTQQAVQPQPRYNLRQKYLVAGGRVTLFANFLRDEAGVVLFVHHKTSQECRLIAWRPDSVTVDLPKLQLPGPQPVEIVIVLPDGRIAKTFRTICEPQPDFLVHSDSIRQSSPAAHAGLVKYVK